MTKIATCLFYSDGYFIPMDSLQVTYQWLEKS